MSGGAFDYKDNVLFDLKDMIAREIGYMEYGGNKENNNFPKNPKVVKYMKYICNNLGKLGNVLHSLDWYLSGDTGEEKFIKDFEGIINKTDTSN